MKLFWIFLNEIIANVKIACKQKFLVVLTILEENHACSTKSVHELVGRAAAAQ